MCALAFADSPFATALTEGEQHVVRYMNAAWLRFFDVGEASALGQPFAQSFPEIMARDPDLLDTVFRTGKAVCGRDPPASPYERRVTMAAWPWMASTSKPRPIVIQLTEVTRQDKEHSFEEEFVREIRTVNEQLLLAGLRERDRSVQQAQLLEGAEEESRAKSTFISSLSHELRTPITALLGYVELITEGLAGPVTDKQKQMLGRVEAAALHLLTVVEQILTFSRAEAGQLVMKAEPFEANALVRDAAALLEPLLRKKNLKFHVQVPEQALPMDSDAGLLKQILINLLTNAVKFTDAGEILLEVREQAKDIIFTIRDTGIGIPPKELERIFDPFQQVKQDGARRSEGTGLGLTVSRRLARLLGGDLTVQSTLGQGSTFTVRIPRQRASRDGASRE